MTMAYVFLYRNGTFLHDVGVVACRDTFRRAATGKTYLQMLASGDNLDVISYESVVHSLLTTKEELFLIPDTVNERIANYNFLGVMQFGSGDSAYDVAVLYDILYLGSPTQYFQFIPFFRYGNSFDGQWNYNTFTELNEITTVSQSEQFSNSVLFSKNNNDNSYIIYLTRITSYGAFALSTRSFKTTDGVAWSTATASANAIFTTVSSTSTGVFIAVGYELNASSYIYTSANGGMTYSKSSKVVSADAKLYCVNGIVMLVTHDGTGYRVESTTDGVTWVNRGYPFGSANRAYLPWIGYVNSKYVFQSTKYFTTSTDLSSYDAVVNYATSYYGNYSYDDALIDVVWTDTYEFFSFSGALYGYVAIDTAEFTGTNTDPIPYTAVIQGTLRLDTSDGVFAARKVYLYNYTTGAKVAETTSDGTTGAWEFTQVAPGDYFVVGAAQGDDLNVPRDFDALGVITITE